MGNLFARSAAAGDDDSIGGRLGGGNNIDDNDDDYEGNNDVDNGEAEPLPMSMSLGTPVYLDSIMTSLHRVDSTSPGNSPTFLV